MPWSSRATSRPSWTRCARATSSSPPSRTSCARRSPRSSAISISRSRSPSIPDHVRSNLDIAERNAERLLGIVADILAASSSSSSSVEASIAPRRHRRAGHRARVRRGPRPARRRAAPSRSTRPGCEEAFVSADPLRLRQVVDNLLSNAITYNRDGGTVFLGTTSDGISSWILVRDTGVGMTEEERARLFQRFYKAGALPPRGHGPGAGDHAATSSAPMAASSACTARPASARPSSSNSRACERSPEGTPS